MEKISVTNGVFWISIPEVDLRILCGCPADSVKHLMHKGLIVPEEKDGVATETGPNAILLSESLLQNGQFTNLAEFPILQMFYRQGFILPGHPNNTGKKPMLIGRKESIETQAEYIMRGNYGLVSKEEMLKSGASPELCEQVWRYKLRYAFDNIRQTSDLIDTKTVEDQPIEIVPGVMIQRIEFNVYRFTYNGESTTVDLNLEKGTEYLAPFKLGSFHVQREYFSVIHSGEGDGWDPDRPCMASIISFQGKIYLVDAGPNLLHSLRALGIGTTEIEGVFHTHSHDDHFNGLTALMGSDHRIKYYAAPLVRQSTIKKFTALLAMEESEFHNFFDVHDLELGDWNDIDGLEVRPVMSPHPVETSILFFRTLWEDDYKTYAHLADLSSMKVLEGMVEEDGKKSGMSRELFESVRDEYLTPTDVKKVDIGGGLIHGDALDFRKDRSKKILLSHWSQPLSHEQREIGSTASFGVAEVLIEATQDYNRAIAFHHLKDYYPGAPFHGLRMLLNCKTELYTPGSIVVRKDELSDSVYFVLSGILEFVSSEYRVSNKLSVGSLAGELAVIRNEPSRGTYRAASHSKVLKIPRNLYVEFLTRYGLMESAQAEMIKRMFLHMTWLIGEKVSCPLKNRIARSMEKVDVPKGWTPPSSEEPSLYLLQSGEIHLSTEGHIVSVLDHGNFFGEENIITTQTRDLQAQAVTDATVWRVPASSIEGIPIIYWKMIEAHEKRMKRYHEAEKAGTHRIPQSRPVNP